VGPRALEMAWAMVGVKKDIKALFGEQLRKLRTERGIRQEELARLAGLDRTYISKIERGERNVSLETVSKLAQALDIPVSHLFEFSGDPRCGT